VNEHARRRIGSSVAKMTVSELQQRDQHRIQILALCRKHVFEAGRMLLVRAPLDDFGVRQTLQARRQHVGRDVEARLELVEAPHAAKQVAQDQQRPPIADDVERARDRARARTEGLPRAHVMSVPEVGCKKQLTRLHCAA
jgi:hypothetical protein